MPKVLKIIGINLFLFVFLLFAAEMGTRLISWSTGNGFLLAPHELSPFHPAIQEIYHWHPFTGFIFTPGIVISGSHPNQNFFSTITIDENGFPFSESRIPHSREPNEILIATVGGSTTANISLNFDQNWPGKLGTLLQTQYPDKKVRILNAGIPGFNTSQSIGNLALRVMPYHPDLVIIYHAYNDLKAIRSDVTFKPDYTHIHSRPYGFHQPPSILKSFLIRSMLYVRTVARNEKSRKERRSMELVSDPFNAKGRLRDIPEIASETYQQHLDALVGIAQSGDAEVILSSFATLHDVSIDYQNPENIGALTSLQKTELLSMLHFTPGLTLDAVFKGLDLYNQINRQVAEQKNAGFVDNAGAIPHEDQYFVDRVHLSVAGAEKMAENLLPEVINRLEAAGKL